MVPRMKNGATQQRYTHDTTQYVILLLLTLFIGWFLGIERVLVPAMAKDIYHISSYLYILSFLAAFGFTKSVLNLVSGKISDDIGRKKLLLIGWLVAIPVPFIFYFSTSWNMIVLANIGVGVNQAFAWTMTVTAGLDLSRSTSRGLTVGLNEAAGYIGQATAGIITGYMAASYGLRGASFLFGIVVVIVAIGTTALTMRETVGFAKSEELGINQAGSSVSFIKMFTDTSWSNRLLFSYSQAGLFEKFVDVVFWGLMPLYLLSLHFGLFTIAVLVGIYQITWGVAQIITGRLSDHIDRNVLIITGFWIDSTAMVGFVFFHGIVIIALLSFLAGLGMAFLYPVLIAAVNDKVKPSERGTRLGIYRFWRDSGYGFGAIFVGILASALNVRDVFIGVALLMAISGGIIMVACWINHHKSSVP